MSKNSKKRNKKEKDIKSVYQKIDWWTNKVPLRVNYPPLKDSGLNPSSKMNGIATALFQCTVIKAAFTALCQPRNSCDIAG